MRSLPKFLLLVATLSLGSVTACKKAEPPPEKLTRGAELYGRMCAVCHGENGEGYKADQAPRLAQPDFQATASDEQLREAIKNGRLQTTMSAWSKDRGGPLSPEDIEEVIHHLRTWRKDPQVALDEKPISGDSVRGEAVFARECVRCHGEGGVGGPNVHIGNPQLLQTVSNGFLRYAIKHGRPGTLMPAFEKTIDEAGIEDLTALLRSWANPPPPPPPPPPTSPLPLGPVPLNPKGPDPVGFKLTPETTSLEVIHAQLERGARMALLDARAPSDYITQHITGAVSVPFYDPTPYLAKLPKNSWLVCYCACPHAESGTLASKLLQAGFKKVTVLDEGLGAWAQKKYGVSSGEQP
ncbi:MAG TPA: c-type cytochrome [Polyangiaceae bacterium]|nr:c-type cytochrome [Polyangiaceae bacterium]